MQSNNVTPHPSDRLTWLWLAIGAILLPFANIQTVWPIAAWLAPVFLMRFSRARPLKVGLTLILVAQIFATAIGMRNDYTAIPAGPLLIGAILAYSLLFWLPFLLDRLLVARLQGVLRTLVFPLAAVTLNYLLLFTPFHTLGSPAYTQYGNLPLMHLPHWYLGLDFPDLLVGAGHQRSLGAGRHNVCLTLQPAAFRAGIRQCPGLW